MMAGMAAIQHVSLEVDPALVEEEIHFWELLGFGRIEPPAGIGESSVWMGAGEQAIHLLAVGVPVVPAKGHIALVEPELDRVSRALSEAGIPVEQAAPHWGAERLKVTSPVGHLVELMAAPPG